MRRRRMRSEGIAAVRVAVSRRREFAYAEMLEAGLAGEKKRNARSARSAAQFCIIPRLFG